MACENVTSLAKTGSRQWLHTTCGTNDLPQALCVGKMELG